MNNNNKKAALYIRVSTEEQNQKGYSLAGQEEELKEYAKHKGYDVHAIYSDGGYSGKNFNRPQVQRMFRDMSNKMFDVIIVWKVDRLSRSNKDVLSLIDDELKPRNMKLLIKTCDIDSSTPNGYMFISLLGTFAQYERSIIIERVNSGMERVARVGNWNGGKVLGYNSVNKKLEINKEESKIVKDIYKMRAEGLGYKKIADNLNAIGKKTKKGNPFSIPAIKLILENEIYIGNIIWGKYRNWEENRRGGKSENPIRVENKHEAIIDIELWNKVQQIKKINKNTYSTNRNFKGSLFLTGVLKCPVCGAGTVMSKTRKRNKKGYHVYYMCQNFHSKGKYICKPNLIKREIIEEKVLKVIKGIISSDNIVNEVINRLEVSKSNDVVELKGELTILKRELKKSEEDQLNLDKRLLNGDKRLKIDHFNRISDQIQEKINELSSSIENIKRLIQKNESNVTLNRDVIINTLKNFDTLFEKANGEEKKLLIRSLVKSIEMEKDRKEIKNIAFWFSDGEDLQLSNDLPPNKVRRTVPQVKKVT
ncbi:recombinase family protein [Rossellomorea oryzaecorticis]|uniref:Recombinase family protein n=1 Tax=Rossellomorea oryzaecorticis TaxID=1396505 RepID=A0ABU9K7N0_9BACI